MNITKATIEDLDSLVEMGGKFFMEAGWGDVASWDDNSARVSLEQMIDSESAILLVAKSDIIIGMIGALVFPLWFNPSVKMAQEFFWYVKPEERNGVGVKLLQSMQDRAIEMGVDALAMLSVEQLPSLDSFYAKNGFRPSEKTFIKRL